MSGLPAGTYGVSVENVVLFRPFHQGGVEVGGETHRLDIRLDDFNLNTVGNGGEQFAELLEDKPAPSGPTPRAGDGKPDLSGFWQKSLASLVGPAPWAEAVAKKRPLYQNCPGQ